MLKTPVTEWKPRAIPRDLEPLSVYYMLASLPARGRFLTTPITAETKTYAKNFSRASRHYIRLPSFFGSPSGSMPLARFENPFPFKKQFHRNRFGSLVSTMAQNRDRQDITAVVVETIFLAVYAWSAARLVPCFEHYDYSIPSPVDYSSNARDFCAQVLEHHANRDIHALASCLSNAVTGTFILEPFGGNLPHPTEANLPTTPFTSAPRHAGDLMVLEPVGFVPKWCIGTPWQNLLPYIFTEESNRNARSNMFAVEKMAQNDSKALAVKTLLNMMVALGIPNRYIYNYAKYFYDFMEHMQEIIRAVAEDYFAAGLPPVPFRKKTIGEPEKAVQCMMLAASFSDKSKPARLRSG
ncbi:MAG: hypothetical protein QW318_07670 [Candidatus Caldarchaeum sp.]